MTQIELWLTQYETDVRFPDVSGMEHLDMLLTRSRIAEHKDDLSAEQSARLADADQRLLHNARQFNRAILAVADLTAWREDAGVSPDHWWWYLDVLTNVPQLAQVGD
ncbi:MAG: hypothetical protein KBF17_11900 [Candidatus Promineofilum sp.]|nr:hypothetical protein [Promineifilum sp.]MBP9656192.1 hypothetical protein [Promineifilum sp.]